MQIGNTGKRGGEMHTGLRFLLLVKEHASLCLIKNVRKSHQQVQQSIT